MAETAQRRRTVSITGRKDKLSVAARMYSMRRYCRAEQTADCSTVDTTAGAVVLQRVILYSTKQSR